MIAAKGFRINEAQTAHRCRLRKEVRQDYPDGVILPDRARGS